MNSLSQLNSLGTFSYTDNRAPRPIFDRPLADNQTVSVNQHDTHTVPSNINIIDIIRPADAGVTYTIDLSATPDFVASWETVPSGVGYSNPSFGIYRLSNLQSAAHWNTVKNPLITPDSYYVGTFSYTVTIGWLTGSISWTVNVTINDITNLSTPSDFYFNKAESGTITGNATVIDNYSTTWTVTVTPSNPASFESLTAGGSGGTVTYNSSTRALTIKGTKTQVNSRLNAISYVIPTTNKTDFTLAYYAVNDATNEGDAKTQNFYSLEYIGQTRATDTYLTNTLAYITNGPQITDSSYNGSGRYTMTVTPTDTTSISLLSSQGKDSWAVSIMNEATGDTTLSSDIYLNGHAAVNSDLTYYAVSESTNASGAGQVRIYTREDTTLTLQQTLAETQSTSGVGSKFGEVIDVNDAFDVMVALAPGDDGALSGSLGQDRGAVYLFTRTGTAWTKRQRIASPTSTNYFENCKLSPDGSTLVVVAPTGSTGLIYVYTRSGNTWGSRVEFTGATQFFGDNSSTGYKQVKVVFNSDGTQFFVADTRESTYAGSVSVYRKVSSTWSLLVKLTEPTSAGSYRFFGDFIQRNSDGTFSIYSQGDQYTSNDEKFYVYTYNGTTWTNTSTVNNPRLIYSSTTDGTYIIDAINISKLNGSTYEDYSTLITANTSSFIGLISSDGAYIVGHTNSSGTQYLQVFTKTANDPDVSSYSSSNKTLTLHGTRAFINSEIDTIQLTPTTGYNTDITLTYTVTTPRSDTDSRTQLIAHST